MADNYVISTWDTQQPGAFFDSGIQWDVNVPSSIGTVAPYLALVPSENQNKPKFLATLTALLQPLASVQALLAEMPSLYDLDNAVGAQLDTIGLWVGASRYLPIPLSGVYFSLDTPGVGFDEGTWWSIGDPTTNLVSLPDQYYRLLIQAKIVANNWNGTVPGAYGVWDTVFAGTGTGILIQDFGNMHIAFALIGPTPDAVTLALLTTGYFDLKPASVKIDFYMTPSESGAPYFGFDVENENIAGLDVGYFGNVYPGA